MNTLIATMIALLAFSPAFAARRSSGQRHYSRGGYVKVQKPYVRRSSGKVVGPHLKTAPDGTTANNLRQ